MGKERDELVALAEQCEAATGPDRELDAQIGRFAVADFLGHVPDEPQYGCQGFTASLDAAMTLDTPELRQFGGPLALLGEAMDRLYRAKASDDALPRFLAAAFLRARATLTEKTDGE